jgi:hypothetical protein
MVEVHAPQTPHHSLGFNLAVIAIVVAALGLGLAYGIDALSRQQSAKRPEGPDLVRNMGGLELRIPTGWFRYQEAQVSGFVSKIELTLPVALGESGASVPIDVTLMPPSKVRPSARLLDGVYLHQFLPAELSGPPGLIGKPLRGTDGFEGETVWYDALSPDPFVAKCNEPVGGATVSRCLRTVNLAPGLAAIYTFDSGLLMHWQDFDAAVKPGLVRIGAIAP